jgi:hypothetical protein
MQYCLMLFHLRVIVVKLALSIKLQCKYRNLNLLGTHDNSKACSINKTTMQVWKLEFVRNTKSVLRKDLVLRLHLYYLHLCYSHKQITLASKPLL